MALTLTSRFRQAWNAFRAEPSRAVTPTYEAPVIADELIDPQDATQVPPANPQHDRMLWIGRNNADVRVTHDIAMQVDAVWACIDVIASALSSSDWNVYGGMRGDDRKIALPHDTLQYMLNTRANPDMTAQAAKRAMMIAAVGYGNGYAEIERDGAGRIHRLWPIAPNRVEVRRDVEGGYLVYRITQGWSGGFIDLHEGDVFHIRGAGLTGLAGDDVVARAVQSIAMAVALDQFASAYFANGTQMGGLIEYEGKLGDPEYKRLQEQWNEKHRGAKQAFKVGILEGGMKFKALETEADKAQLVEAKHLSVEQICRWFRVPPHKVAHLLRSTNNNIEHQGLEFSRDTLRPWRREIEEEADYKLISNRGPRKFIEIDVDWAEQGDYKSRAEAYQVLRNIGVFSGNDVLRKLGENTIGKEGDIRIVQGAMVPLGDVGAAYTKPAPAAGGNDDPQEDIAQDWLTTVYQRVQNRHHARLTDLLRAGREDAAELARQDALEAAAKDIAPLARWLDDRADAAVAWVEQVIDGITTPEAAAEAFIRKVTA